MAYFNVRVSHTTTTDFVVNAPTRKQAEELAAVAAANGKTAGKKIARLIQDTEAFMSVHDGTKADWANALKRQKEQ